jgi:O-antigen/teichoic acid export membrane protein
MVLAIGLYTTSYFLQAILAPLQGVIAGYERLDVLSVFQVIGQIIFIIFGALFLFSGFDFVWLVIASLINLPILIILSYQVIRRNRYTFPRYQIQVGTWVRLIISGLPFAFIQLSLTTAYQFDRLILEPTVTKEFIGWYSAAYTLTRAFLVLTAAFSASLVLTLAREHAKNPAVVRPWYYRSVKFSIFLGLPLAIGGTLLADKIIQSAYGVEYAPAAVAFAILIWDTPLLMYTALGGNIATSIQKEGRSVRIYVAEAVLNILLNLYLIPRYGVIAACFATVATELLGAILFYVLFRREFGPGLGFKHIIRLGLAALFMGAAVVLLRDFHLLIAVGVGTAVYLLMVWLTKALTAEERDLLTGMGRRVLRKLRVG